MLYPIWKSILKFQNISALLRNVSPVWKRILAIVIVSDGLNRNMFGLFFLMFSKFEVHFWRRNWKLNVWKLRNSVLLGKTELSKHFGWRLVTCSENPSFKNNTWILKVGRSFDNTLCTNLK